MPTTVLSQINIYFKYISDNQSWHLQHLLPTQLKNWKSRLSTYSISHMQYRSLKIFTFYINTIKGQNSDCRLHIQLQDTHSRIVSFIQCENISSSFKPTVPKDPRFHSNYNQILRFIACWYTPQAFQPSLTLYVQLFGNTVPYFPFARLTLQIILPFLGHLETHTYTHIYTFSPSSSLLLNDYQHSFREIKSAGDQLTCIIN